jgi:hypothetical protein
MAVKKRKRRRKSDVERLHSQLISLKKNLPNCQSEQSRNNTMQKIYEVERKLEIAKGNVKSGLASRGLSIVRGGSPGLGKR